jgi:DNA-directed RNA polymerase specialized sigma24 family protein
LVAAYGTERGREAAAEALAFAWEHWPMVRSMKNPAGYLYRVGQSHTRPRRVRPVFGRADIQDSTTEPRLPTALGELSERQRVAVVLVHGYGWTLREVAELTGTRVTTVQSHVERGLRRLQSMIGSGDEVV